MNEYTITVTCEDSTDIVTFIDPVRAIDFIQDNREAGCKVTYTGNPFRDVAAMLED